MEGEGLMEVEEVVEWGGKGKGGGWRGLCMGGGWKNGEEGDMG